MSIPGSSNGRTPEFGSGNGGSTPSPGAILPTATIVDLPQRADAQQALDDKAAEEFKAPSWQAAAKVWRDNLRRMQGRAETRSCYCIGRQNGQPVCPCRMERVCVVDGRYIEVIDHGPAPKALAREEGR